MSLEIPVSKTIESSGHRAEGNPRIVKSQSSTQDMFTCTHCALQLKPRIMQIRPTGGCLDYTIYVNVVEKLCVMQCFFALLSENDLRLTISVF